MDDNEGISSFLRLTGANIPSRARFVGQAFVAGTLSSFSTGVLCGQAGVLLGVGPLMPFLVGSWAGYGFGLYHFWGKCKKDTLAMAENYPRILSHELWVQWQVRPVGNVQEWLLRGTMQQWAWSILAMQGCQADVAEVERKQRDQLIEESVETSGARDLKEY